MVVIHVVILAMEASYVMDAMRMMMMTLVVNLEVNPVLMHSPLISDYLMDPKQNDEQCLPMNQLLPTTHPIATQPLGFPLADGFAMAMAALS